MRTFISGGCKNGKSYIAQRLAYDMRTAMGADASLYYVATMLPSDSEDNARIARHVAEREGWGFITVEQPVNILECLNRCSINSVFLFDSITALLANEMFPATAGADFSVVSDAHIKIAGELECVLAHIKSAVFVSDYIYSDAAIYDEYTENYRSALAFLDKMLAAECETVLEVCYGNVIVHKGVFGYDY